VRDAKKEKGNLTNMWQGVVLEESLENKSLLNLAKIVGTDIDKLEEEDRVMTFHKIEVSESERARFIKEAKDSLKPGFYIHLCQDGRMYVIFKNKVFKFRKGQQSLLEKAREYGKSTGIISEQMPFEHLIDYPFD
jgi:hypothetical protein